MSSSAKSVSAPPRRNPQQEYLESTKFVKDATSEAERKKFQALLDLFRRYGEQYKFDYLLMAAQGYQESRLDHGAKSSVGAIGVMQLMPETGKEQKVATSEKSTRTCTRA